VVVGNGRSARVKQLVRNSLAKEDGLDITAVQSAVGVDPEPEPKPELSAPQLAAVPAKQAANTASNQDEQPMFRTIKNSRDLPSRSRTRMPVTIGSTTELAPGATVDVQPAMTPNGTAAGSR
jgi:hypothetical protein